MGALPKFVFCVAAIASAVIYTVIVYWLVSVSEIKVLTAAQHGAALAYGIGLSVWAGAEAAFLVFRYQPRYVSAAEDEEAASEQQLMEEKAGSDAEKPISPALEKIETTASIFCIRHSHLPGLRAAAEFIVILGYIYVCDRTSLIAKGPKMVDKFSFWAVNALILLVALCTLRSHGSISEPMKPLQRDQTEEWKGWMQIMFVLYHYFAEAEIYNAIRLYIAAYVWMTGFGNFSYYYVKADFTPLRFVQMMWRLNFFVFFICITMNNEYMLYYICAMHTFFTWLVYWCLFIGSKFNTNNVVLFGKIFVTVIISVILYDVPGTFQTVFAPFKFLLDFHDPLHPENSPGHEWFFRSGLDHLVWIFGMICAFSFPWCDDKLQTIERLPAPQKLMARTALFAVTAIISLWWYFKYFTLQKRDYNKVHPFTSFIPIFCYMVFRNLSPLLRRWHMHMFAWTGKITLETYILQFHIWMKTTGINGSPKHLMVVLPGWYWTNFVLCTAIYIFISYRVFHITNTLKEFAIPRETSAIAKQGVFAAIAIAAFYVAGVVLKG